LYEDEVFAIAGVVQKQLPKAERDFFFSPQIAYTFLDTLAELQYSVISQTASPL